MHGGHIGIHFEKHFTKMFVKSSRYCRTNIVSKYGNLMFYQRRVFCMSHILAAILKNKFDEDVRGVGQIL